MTDDGQRDRARRLLALHVSAPLLVLPNVWNPAGARVLAARGYPAVATASAAVSASLGYADGESIRRATLIDVIGRIARSVEVPVTADIEAGYGATIPDLQDTIGEVLDAGVVGINIEDSLEEASTLRPVEEQCARIAAAREVADRRRVHLVINARVDSFISSASGDRERAFADAVRRAASYVEAGADCVYPIGPNDEETVRRLRAAITAPINVIAAPGAAPLTTLESIGVNRVSFGPFVFRTWLKQLARIADDLAARRGYECLDVMPSSEAAAFLSGEREPGDG